jgi:hypothetical protein
MEKTWIPTTAGILSIVAGAMGLLFGIGLILGFGLLAALVGWFAGAIPGLLGGLLAVLAIPWIVLGIVAIVGGTYALRRRVWGLALAGAICALLTSSVLGIVAIIFVALGKNEFE